MTFIDSKLSFTAIKGLALKNKGDITGDKINVPDGQTLTITEDKGKIKLSTDPHKSYASYIIHRIDKGSKLVVKKADCKDNALTAKTPAKEAIFNRVDKLSNTLIRINDYIHDYPEIGLQEKKACKILTSTLKANGFKIKTPVSDMDTAFEATYVNKKPGGPVIGILAEYDALPEMGHGCGHNVIAASAIGAALALSKSLGNQPATIKVFGTPAEETVGGKIKMAKQGLFDQCDAVLMAHPSDTTTAGVQYLALQDLKIVYKGKPAHAASAEDGRSALAAAQAFLNGTDSLRQFVRSDVKLHGIISHGGDASNVVPERTEIQFTVRADDKDCLKEVVERVKKVAQASAISTETKVKIETGGIFENTLIVPKLTKLLLQNAELAGVKNIQEESGGGSTDFGNVTQRVPADCLDIEFVKYDTPCHTKAWVDAAKSPAAHKAVINASKAMAATAYDLITNPQLLKDIKKEHRTIKKGLELS